MTKQELELQVKELTGALTQFELDRVAVAGKLDKAKSDLEDVSKPEITREFVNEIREAVSQAIGQCSFDNVDSYDVDFEINYDNQLALSSIEYNDPDEIEETVCDYIESLFKVIDTTDDEN